MISNNPIPEQQNIVAEQTNISGSVLSNENANILVLENLTSSSVLIGEEIDSISLSLSKVGTPTGLTYLTICDVLVNCILHDSINMTELTTTPTWYNFQVSHSFASGDSFGLHTGFITTTNASHGVIVNISSTDTFDGVNSVFSIDQVNMITQDLSFVLYLGDSSSIENADTINVLLSAFIILAVVLVLIMLIRFFFNE